jgi:Pyruvate/2-oxoacid:ferredoxin oxidoreductase delta subunit
MMLGRLRAAWLSTTAAATAADDRPALAVAVIQGRHCLAYRSLSCSSCVERCPQPGAIAVDHGIPRVVAGQCTGCAICHDVCPAPTNAVLMIGSPQRSQR